MCNKCAALLFLVIISSVYVATAAFVVVWKCCGGGYITALPEALYTVHTPSTYWGSSVPRQILRTSRYFPVTSAVVIPCFAQYMGNASNRLGTIAFWSSHGRGFFWSCKLPWSVQHGAVFWHASCIYCSMLCSVIQQLSTVLTGFPVELLVTIGPSKPLFNRNQSIVTLVMFTPRCAFQ